MAASLIHIIYGILMADTIAAKVLEDDRLPWIATLSNNVLFCFRYISNSCYFILIGLLLGRLLFLALSKDMRQFLFFFIKPLNWWRNFFESWWLLFLCCWSNWVSSWSSRIVPTSHSLFRRSRKHWWAFRLYYSSLRQYHCFSLNFLRLASTNLLFLLSFCNC